MTDQRGGAFYDVSSVLDRYLAHRERVSPNHLMEEPAVLDEVGDPTGLRVLDLGCGDAAFGRLLLAAGARSYLGVDGSRRMVERAAGTLTGTVGQVRHVDLEDFVAERDSADLVTARLSLHYVADLDAVLRTVVDALVPDGRFVMTVVHPVVTSHDNRPRGPARAGPSTTTSCRGRARSPGWTRR